jgi:hypothetical protein
VIGTGSVKTDGVGDAVKAYPNTSSTGSQYRIASPSTRYPLGPRDVISTGQECNPIPYRVADNFLHSFSEWKMSRDDAALWIGLYNDWAYRRRLALQFAHPVRPQWNEARFFYGPEFSDRFSAEPDYFFIKPKGSGDFMGVFYVKDWNLSHHFSHELIDTSKIEWAAWAQLYRRLRGTKRVRRLENG